MEEENEDRNKKQEKISHQNTTTHTYTNYKPLLYHPEKGPIHTYLLFLVLEKNDNN